VVQTEIGQTTHIEYGLSPELPVFLDSRTYDEELPLSVDLHEALEVGIVLSGAQERHWQGFTCIAQPGDVWLCGSWEPHGFRALPLRSQHVALFFLPGYVGDEMFGGRSWLTPFAVPPGQRPRIDSAEKRELVLALGDEFLREYQRDLPDWETGVRLDLLKVLFALCRGWTPPSAPSAVPHVRPASLARILPALRLVHARPVRRVSLAEAAAACCLSRARFSLVFRATMGLAFGQFCLRARLAAAADLLLNTQLPVEAIAAETGFWDASHLHRSFVRGYGATPACYRQQGQFVQAPRPPDMTEAPGPERFGRISKGSPGP